MNIAKALKVKSRIINRLNEVQRHITLYNSCESNVKNRCASGDNDVSVKLTELTGLYTDLVSIKTAIAKANRGIFEKLEDLAQRKAFLTYISGINTNEGKQILNYGPDGTPKTFNVIVATVTEAQKQSLKENIQKDIEDLQDAIDAYNATTEVKVVLNTFKV